MDKGPSAPQVTVSESAPKVRVKYIAGNPLVFTVEDTTSRSASSEPDVVITVAASPGGTGVVITVAASAGGTDVVITVTAAATTTTAAVVVNAAAAAAVIVTAAVAAATAAFIVSGTTDGILVD